MLVVIGEEVVDGRMTDELFKEGAVFLAWVGFVSSHHSEEVIIDHLLWVFVLQPSLNCLFV